jgi:hypothetical protein
VAGGLCLSEEEQAEDHREIRAFPAHGRVFIVAPAPNSPRATGFRIGGCASCLIGTWDRDRSNWASGL